MSDPLSAIASVVTICELAVKVAHYLDGVRNTPEETRSFREELLRISQLLHLLLDYAKGLSSFGVPFPAFETLVNKGGPLEQFKHILESLAERLGLGDSGFKNTVKRISWPFRKEEVKAIFGSLERYKTLFLLALSHDQTRLLAAIRDDFSANQQKVLDGIRKLAVSHDKHEVRETELEKQRLITWLSPIDFLQIQSDLFGRHKIGTGTWLLNNPTYTEWVTFKHGAFWCRVDPGTGKTILASIIVNELRKRFKDEDNVGVFCVYCNYKERNVQTVANLLASICAQSLHQSHCSIPEKLKALYASYCKTKDRLTLPNVSDLLRDEMGRYNRVFIVIDALDECPDLGNERNVLLAELAGLMNSATHMQLLFTSRPFIDILPYFPDCKITTISAHTEDIELYARSRLPELHNCVKRDPDLQNEIVSRICQTASGMFLLAHLNFEVFKDKLTPWKVRNAIKKLPEGNSGLKIAYDQALKRIDEQNDGHREVAHLVLTWVVHTCRPLTILELQHALCIIDPGSLDQTALLDPEHLTAFCAGLVTIGADDGTVRLVHYTAHSYFESIRQERYPDSDKIIAKACLEYIAEVVRLSEISDDRSQSENSTDSDDIFTTYPFLQYALRQWTFHVHEARDSESDLIELIMRIDGIEPCMMLSAASIWGDEMDHWCIDVTLLMVVAFFGFEKTVKALLERGADVNIKCQKHRTALHYATAGNQPAIASILLDHGADVNAVSTKLRTPLHEAIRRYSRPMVTVLLDRGADVNMPNQHYASAVHMVEEIWENYSGGESDDSPNAGNEQGGDTREAETELWNLLRERDYHSAYGSSVQREVEKIGILGFRDECWELTKSVLRHPGADLTGHGGSLLVLAEKGETPYGLVGTTLKSSKLAPR